MLPPDKENLAYRASMDDELCEELQVPSGTITSIGYNILTAAEAEKISVLSIEAVSDVTDPRLGFPNQTYHCSTCGAKSSTDCEGHFGLIKFPSTTLHPYFLSETASILNKICPGCKSIRRDKVKRADMRCNQRPSNCKYCDVSFRKYYPAMKFKISSGDIFGKTAIAVEVKDRSSNSSQNKSREVLASDYWDFIPKDVLHEEGPIKPYKRILSHAQVYSILKDIDSRFFKEFVTSKASLFLTCFPVTPNCHRVAEFGQHMIFDPRTKAYKRLVDFRGTANELNMRVRECLKMSKLRFDKLSANDMPSNVSGMKYVKEVILGKRTGHAFRMVVVGDPNIKLSEIGIPCYIAEKLQISENLTSWNWDRLNTICNLRMLEKGEVYVRRKGELVRVRFMGEFDIGDTIFRPLFDGDIILINRPPSIHHHSLIALTVKVLPIHSVLSINPLTCSPFRGDFDGDCLHGYVPQSVDSRIELRELVALDKQLINSQSGRNLLSLSQDSLTAAHLVVEDGEVLNIFEMQQLQMFSPFQFPSPAIAKAPPPRSNYSNDANSCFWTGKQLFSLLLPPDFDYVFPSNDVHISQGELLSSSSDGGSSWLRDSKGNLFHSLVNHCQQKSLDFLYAAQELLCEWLSNRGFSVSISDLYMASDSCSRKHMIEEVSCGLREAEQISHMQLLMVTSNQDFLAGNGGDNDIMEIEVESMCYEKQKSAALSRASASAFKQVFRDIQNLVFPYAGKDNSLLAMLKAGSKGNLMRFVQHGMCLGLQHSLVPLSFSIPHQLSCAAWNNSIEQKNNDISEPARSYIPCALVESSFLTGLNPLECFVHSLTTRDSSFSDNAALPGTLNRRLMFFMRDLYIGYDGTVRNSYGNHVVQFTYNVDDASSQDVGNGDSFNEYTYECGPMVNQAVGSLAACAISEAAYSALDQPISALETSPLLNLKKVLECGVKKISGSKTATLFLSKNLGRWAHGFEYGALEVQHHLERLIFSDIVSTVMIFFSPQTSGSSNNGIWVCHFHISKEILKRKRLTVLSIINALYTNCDSTMVKSKFSLPNLKITSKDCNVADIQKENRNEICITVKIVESSTKSFSELETLRDMVIPHLLRTAIKGFVEFKKVDIFWKDPQRSVAKSYKGYFGELCVRVHMSENCNRKCFWGVLVNNCLKIMDMIDWQRSHPDDIHDVTLAYGIDVAWQHFSSNLKSAISDTGKNVLPEHLLVATDCLSASGEFVALNSKGLAQQRRHTTASSPFIQACFSNPGDSFIKAAKLEAVDTLQGSVDALSWGQIPSIGTSGHFELLYSEKGHELAKPENVYELLGSSSNVGYHQQNVKVKVYDEQDQNSVKCSPPPLHGYGNLAAKEHKNVEISLATLRSFLTLNDIQKLTYELRHMLHKYPMNHQLSGQDKAIAMMALSFHPRRVEKIGAGFQEIRIGHHPEYEKSRCFQLVRTDGSVEDFSYHKCVLRALEMIAPHRAKNYQSKWLTRDNVKDICVNNSYNDKT